MKKIHPWFTVSLLSLLLLFLTACSEATPSIHELAQTYAAQTRTAMPMESATPPPTDTLEPTVTATATQTSTSKPNESTYPVGPVDFPENVNPLTGLAVANPENLNRRPVFVKVANYPTSGRPHAGLSAADMVFEYYIGYGMNRFMGLYYGENAEKIGPIRSGRLVDPQIVHMYQGVLGFWSAYVTILDHIQEILGERALSGMSDACPALCDDGGGTVISKFGDSKLLTELADARGVENRKYPLEGMVFDPQSPEGAADGSSVTVLYSALNRGEWRFDAESGLYLRWIEDTSSGQLQMIPLSDRQTEQQLNFANVIVLLAYHTEYAPSMHDVDFWGNTTGQRAVIFRDGKALDAIWKAPRNDQPIQFFNQAGEPVALKPGNSWVVIMGLNSATSEDDGSWTFNFELP
jgi:hypothetical protein